MKYRITYWDMSNRLRTDTIQAADVEAAIDKLADDPQHPLAQVQTVETLEADADPGL